jgi:hypothetical protein
MRFGIVVDDSQLKDEQEQHFQKLTTEYSVILEVCRHSFIRISPTVDNKENTH